MQKSLHCWCQKYCSLDAKNTALAVTEITALLVTVYRAAVGSDGYAVGGAVGAYAGSTSYLGGSLTTSTTVTYDATAAYIQNAISGQRIAALHNTNLEERAAIEKGYLEITTVYPGETISGFVYVERRPADYVEFDFNVEGNKYKFKWR